MTLHSSYSRLLAVAAVAQVLAAPALAQPADFPVGATAPSAAQIKQHLDGRVFDVKLANGMSWRLEYNSRGHFFVDVSNGFRGKGEWGTQDGQLCGQVGDGKRSCNDVRMHEGVMHLKRDSGELIRLMPR